MRSEIEKRANDLKSAPSTAASAAAGSGDLLKGGSFVPLLRLRVLDLLSTTEAAAVNHHTTATLTFWRPSEELCNVLKENSRLRITRVSVGNQRGREDLQLRATKATRVEELKPEEARNFVRFPKL